MAWTPNEINIPFIGPVRVRIQRPHDPRAESTDAPQTAPQCIRGIRWTDVVADIERDRRRP